MKKTNTSSEASSIIRGIQVSGNANYKEHDWRKAILYFLHAIWRNDEDVIYRPKINFSGFVLRLDLETNTYYVYGQDFDETGEAHRDRLSRVLKNKETFEVSCDQNAVEIGLIRFVKNDEIGTLQINFPLEANLTLSKTALPGELAVHGSVNGKPLPTLEKALEFYFGRL